MSSPKAKGKQRATDTSHFEDLSPVLTYKHLLSNSMGVHDPLRVIALVDSDAFYAACEMVRLNLPTLETPLVVKQWESVIAVSYKAREYGITRMDKAKDAMKKCPDLVVVHVPTYKDGMAQPGYWDEVDTMTHKVSLDVYRRESAKIHSIFREILPEAEIERASIDEAFFDLTKPVRTTLLQKFPYLAQTPSDSSLGLDTPLPSAPSIEWNGLGQVIPAKSSADETQSGQNDDVTPTWHDVALAIGAELMAKVRDEVRRKLGYTTSAGIARNKFLAKLCASYKKPSSQSILRNSAIPAYLTPLPFQKIRNLGGKLGETVAQHYNATVVADLLPISLPEMQNTFGPDVIWVWEVLRGIDRSEVKEKAAVNKSMLASKNLPKPVVKQSDGAHWIRILAAELALRLNDARAINPHLWPKTIVLHARKGYEVARSKQAPFPYTRQVTVDTVATAANKLWDELVGKASIHVTNISLAFTNVENSETGQQSIAEFLKAPRSASKRSREDDDSKQEDSLLHDESRAFSCSRCNKSIKVPDGFAVEDKGDRKLLIEQLQQEHSDFHFAQDLAKGLDNEMRTTTTGSFKPPAKRKDKGKGGGGKGIERYFR